MPTRPNILLIVADQHNAKVLGHAGHPQVPTPHLDRMAEYAPVGAELSRDLLNWLITTTRPGTVLQANAVPNPERQQNAQREVRFRTSANRDGKIHPDELKKIAGGGNYL